MRDIVLLNTRTAFIVLLLGNTAFSLQYLPQSRSIPDTRQRSDRSIHQHISTLLRARGLDEEIAKQKAIRLFINAESTIDTKLRHLQAHPALAIKSDAIDDALTKRALFGRSLDLDSYDALVRFVQEVKRRPLDDEALTAIRQIATLNQSLT